MRSGVYERLTVVAIKEGEFISWNPLTEQLRAEFIEDQDKRDDAPTVGYYASFKLLNGFSKALYWTRAKMERHALDYSKGYRAKKGYTFWERDFDGMAYKTMLRQLLGHWGLMTVDLQAAISGDVENADVEEVRTVIPAELLQAQPEALSQDTGAVVMQATVETAKEPEPVQLRQEPRKSAKAAAEKPAPRVISLDDL